MSKSLRKSILFGAPLFVGVINIFHPVYFRPTGIYGGIQGVVEWWITLHILNLFGFALVGLAGYLLIEEQQGISATLAKLGFALFVPTYAGFDSIIGIGTGILIRYAKGLPVDRLVVLNPAIDAFWTNNIATGLAIVGSAAWSISMAMCAATFTEPKRRSAVLVIGLIAGGIAGWGYSASTFGTLPWWIAVAMAGLISYFLSRRSLSISLLILSGILFGTTHVVPYGPLGMACFLLANMIVEFSQGHEQVAQTQAAVAE